MIIEARDCSYRYPHDINRYAIEDINLVVLPAQVLGIVGPNGAGKSTLASLLAGVLKPSQGALLADGTGLYLSRACRASKEVRSSKTVLAAFRRSVALVSQFPEDQFFTESIYQELSFGLKNLGMDKEMIRKRVMDTLYELGLKMDEENLMHRSPFEYGGGEKRLISIAAALVRRPKILILDEPTAGLDAMSSHLVWEIIRRLRLRLRLSIILISHELERLVLLVDRLVVLYEGRIFHQGSPEEVFSKPEGLLTLGLELPQITILGYELEKKGIRLKDRPIFEVHEATELIEKWLKK